MFADSVFFVVSLAVTFGVSLSFIAMSLLLVAAGLSALTAWFWISARPEPQALAPLEVMGQREFAQADDEARKQMLDAVRAVPVIGASDASGVGQSAPIVSVQAGPTVQGETK